MTTRANLQIREIPADKGEAVLTGLHELGVINRGAGADNIRNVTASPTAGIDPQELIDTRPLARAMHHYILNHREMYGLPRKFNIAFDGGGAISALEDTNDIGFTAVRVGEGKSVPAGVYFRMQLGGITGHKDFARDTGVLLKPEQCVPVAAAVVRVFIENGDRTDRKKARLEVRAGPLGDCQVRRRDGENAAVQGDRISRWRSAKPRPAVVKHGHLGFHPQRQPGLFYLGVLLPVGRMTSEQMRGLADLADRHGGGTIRLTVWQNLLISDIPEDKIQAVKEWIERIGFHWKATNVRGGLVACTGNAGCKYAASNTKLTAHGDRRLPGTAPGAEPADQHPRNRLSQFVRQHYLGDIGLLGTKVEVGDDMVEGYHVFVGGGYGEEQHIGREVFRSVTAVDAPAVIERMLRAYLETRLGPEEEFNAFVKRYPTDRLKELFEKQVAVPA